MPEIRITLKTYLAHLQDTKDIKLSISQLAKDAGLPQATVSKIVNNSVDGISRKKFAAIISALREYDPECDVGKILKYVP